jgi:hypothetical protein
MNKELYKSAEMKLEREIREIVDKPGFTTQDLDIMYKVLDNIKDITIICAMKEESERGYSEKRYMYDDDASYARRRDSMGRYASDSDNRSSYERGYSEHDRMMDMRDR